MKINIYDFDGTIYNGDSSIDFYLYCIKKNKKIIRRIPSFCFNIILYSIKKIKKEQLKENFFSFLNDVKDIDKTINEFWIKHKNKIKKFYIKSKHNNDIIISASPSFLLKPICDELKIKDLIATEIDKKTGKFLSLNCYGKEKVTRLKNKYKNIIIEKFYTDSLSDLPLINISKESYIIKKNKIIKCQKNSKGRK